MQCGTGSQKWQGSNKSLVAAVQEGGGTNWPVNGPLTAQKRAIIASAETRPSVVLGMKGMAVGNG